MAGFVEYRSPQGTPKTLALLQGYVVNQGDAWEYTLNILDRYFDQIIARGFARLAAAESGVRIFRIQYRPENFIQDMRQVDLSAGLGVAVREYPTDTGPADYVLFVSRIPVGVIEARGDLPGDRKPQSGPVAFGAEEWIEDSRDVFFRNAWAIIFDLDYCCIMINLDRDFYGIAIRS